MIEQTKRKTEHTLPLDDAFGFDPTTSSVMLYNFAMWLLWQDERFPSSQELWLADGLSDDLLMGLSTPDISILFLSSVVLSTWQIRRLLLNFGFRICLPSCAQATPHTSVEWAWFRDGDRTNSKKCTSAPGQLCRRRGGLCYALSISSFRVRVCTLTS